MATPRDWIKRSMRILGVLASGETPSSDELTDGLSALNAMLGSWSAQKYMIHAKVREEFTLVGGQSSYTWGTGANFNSSRPLEVDQITVKQVGGTAEIPVEMINADQYAAIVSKSIQSNIPQKAYLTGSYPNQTVILWPVPTEAATLVAYSRKPLTSFANASTTIELPENYEEAVVYNLARRLQSEYGKQLDAEALTLAEGGMDLIKLSNLEPAYITSDAPGTTTGRADIYSGRRS